MFFISFFLVIISSYLITSCIMQKNQKTNLAFLYFLLISFSEIVLTFEILSLVSMIKEIPFLILNLIMLISTLFVWLKQGKPLYRTYIKKDIYKIKNAFKLDKSLKFLFICFCIFISCELFITLVYPITFGDTLKYNLTRCTTWIQNGNLTHFITPDTREIIMPINMELLYSWILLFIKKENGCACFSFISFTSILYLIYNFLGELSFSFRKRLWTIFVFSSFALIGVMTTTPCTELCIGALVLASIYLFYQYIKYNNKIALFFSSLSYALAIGCKTTAIMIIPSICILYLILLYIYKRQEIKQGIIYFSLFFILNFIIFSSYNYILNFIQFHNFISSRELYLMHQFRGGFKSILCSLIKYIFILFDTSGIPFVNEFNNVIINIQTYVLKLINETPQSYMSSYFPNNFEFNSKMTITTAGFGLLGLFTILPSIVFSIKNMKASRIILGLLAIVFILNIIIISSSLLYMQFNIRFLASFLSISSIILVYSYIKNNNNLFKKILCLFMFIYLVGIPHFKPISFTIKYLSTQNTIDKYEKIINIKRDEKDIFKYFINKDKTNIALISAQKEQALFDIEKLKLYGFKIDKLLVDNIKDYDLKKYKFIITNKETTSSNNIINYGLNKTCIYLNRNGNIINDILTEEPTSSQCLVPFNYFYENGFKQINDIKLDNYTILRK